MANPKGKKPSDLPNMKRSRKAIEETPEATSTRIRTCGKCAGNGCKFCGQTGKIDVGLI